MQSLRTGKKRTIAVEDKPILYLNFQFCLIFRKLDSWDLFWKISEKT